MGENKPHAGLHFKSRVQAVIERGFKMSFASSVYRSLLFLFLTQTVSNPFYALEARANDSQYPAHWFQPVSKEGAPAWEILPQEAKPGEVILSKRHELGVLSNFAATPFTLDGKRYASVEGFWQMMLFPEDKDDARAKDPKVAYPHTRDEVAQMTAFKAKTAGSVAEENMKKLGIDWVSFEGKHFAYRSKERGEHYRLILKAMRAKLEQNPEVKKVLLSTGNLVLKPDHHQEVGAPDEWKYNEIWMQFRDELRKKPAAQK